jgi:lysyl-tRNA synthetase class 2
MMLEWCRAGDTHLDQMQVVERLMKELAREVSSQPPLSAPFPRTAYRQAFASALGLDVMKLTAAELAAVARQQGIVPPPGLGAEDRDGWLNLLLVERVEERLGREEPEFLYDYPASQAALARIRQDDPPVAERFELYWRGVELANGYHELCDAEELRGRIRALSARQASEGLQPIPARSRLLDAMHTGLPPCAGVALGFDRLLMLLVGARTIDEVLPFPVERA